MRRGSRQLRARRMVGVLVVALVLASMLVCASAAIATEPWWHVTTSSRPTNLWTASGEVQELQIGSLTELQIEGKPLACVGQIGGEPYEGKDICEEFTGLPFTASPTELAPKLEAAWEIAGVIVSEEAAGNWAITTPGQFVPALETIAPLPARGGSVRVQGGSGALVVTATNLGDAPVEGTTTPVTVTDALPQGVSALKIEGVAGETETENRGPVRCTQPAGPCTFEGQLSPYESIELTIHVELSGEPPVAGAPGEVTVADGDATSVSVPQRLRVGEHTPFGVERYELVAEEEGGSVDTQAGSHPFQFTTTLSLNQGQLSPGDRTEAVEQQPALPRNFRFDLPPGLVGNATVTPRCTEEQFTTKIELLADKCPSDTAVGAAAVTIIEHRNEGLTTIAVPVFNLVPETGEPARFGFFALGVPVVFDTALRGSEGYGVTVSIANVSQAAQLLASTVTLWGVPDDPRHNESRGAECLYQPYGRSLPKCQTPEHPSLLPFLTLPTSCTEALSFPMGLESWSGLSPTVTPFVGGALDGCNRVPFEPQIEVSPSTSAGYSPTALAVRVNVPQQASEATEGVAESDVKNTTVTLPAGLQVNPAAAAGLEACSEAQVGFEHLEESGQAIFSEGEAGCPEASELGTVEVSTPLLEKPLEGIVYQAAQEANPFGSLLALYVVAENKERGVRVKLAGQITPDANTGQLVTTFAQTPQLPFGEFTLKLFDGSKAPLATSFCGAYQTAASIEPWSGGAAARPASEFAVTSGPGGTPCRSPGLFAPSFLAGATDNQAAAFSPFTLELGRRDGEQTLSTVSMQIPVGLLGMLSKVQLCSEPQARTGACSTASQIGHVTVTAGVGSEPLTLPEAGKPQDPVFLTGPYDGAPFGLSIVVPAESGPFNLGTVVVRAAIHIDPATSQINVTSEPMPTRLQGIPLDVRTVEVAIDREGFMFNPTNCAPLAVNGTIGSAEGTVASVSSHFEAANCATLPFKPSFTVSTSGKTSKASGASLHVLVTAPGQGPQAAGTASQPGKQEEANIKSVKVELPVQLPSRLIPTIQNACPEAVYNANPAECQAKAPDSLIGMAIAHTPILNVPLAGPAYLVSHGGAAFPDLVVILQGEGITIELTGSINIKHGITTSEFAAVPDAPISTFELTLPEGPHSALATNIPEKLNRNLCGQKMIMPTEITGQNGAVEKQETRIEVEGCSNALVLKSKKVGPAGKTLSLQVEVPAAGRLTASGKGVTSTSKSSTGREFLSLSVSLGKADAKKVASHRSVNVKLKLSFVPKSGKHLTKSFAATYQAKKK